MSRSDEERISGIPKAAELASKIADEGEQAFVSDWKNIPAAERALQTNPWTNSAASFQSVYSGPLSTISAPGSSAVRGFVSWAMPPLPAPLTAELWCYRCRT